MMDAIKLREWTAGTVPPYHTRDCNKINSVKERTEKLLRVLNAVNRQGKMPAIWKMARVVLIPKPGKYPALPSSFRPINVLPALSKVWEHTFKALLERSIGLNRFQINQYEFRGKKNTVDASCRVDELAETCRRKDMICVLVAIDIKNAFSILSWNKNLQEAEERKKTLGTSQLLFRR